MPITEAGDITIVQPFGDDPSNKTQKTSTEVGTVDAATTITVVEEGISNKHKTVLTLTDFAVGSATGAAALCFGALMYTLPAGAAVIEAVYMSVALTGTVTIVADTPEIGIGSVLGAGVQATIGAAGATMEDYWEGSASAAIDGTTPEVGTKVATAGALTGIAINEAASAKTLYLNVADTWAGIGDVTGTGTIVIDWVSIS